MRLLPRRHDVSVLYLAFIDYMVIVGSFAVIMRMRFRPHIDIIDISRLHIIPQVLFIFFYAALMLGVFSALGLYKRKLWLSPLWHSIQIVKGTVISIIGYIFLQYISKSSLFMEYRSVTFSWAMVLPLCLWFHRVIIFDQFRKFVSKSDWRRRVVIIGASDIGKEFAEKCLSGQDYPTLKIVGFLDDQVPEGEPVSEKLKCLGQIASLPEIIDLYNIEGAVVTSSRLSYQQLIDTAEECVRLFGWVDIHSDKALCLQENLDPDTYFEIPFVRMGDIPKSVLMKSYKRISDFILSGLGILLLSPVFLITAVLIKLTSPGPVLYISERIGYKESIFKFYKFRSMRVGADNDVGRKEKMEEFIQNEDSALSSKIISKEYLTPVGRLIRKWAIDELPQLFNVWKGDMSIVGPRPSPVDEYAVNDEWHKKRFEIKPGCTGLWKLYAAQTGSLFSQSVLYDIYYARNMNPLLDLYIILGTIRLILEGKADQ